MLLPLSPSSFDSVLGLGCWWHFSTYPLVIFAWGLPFNVLGRPDCVKVPRGIPFIMGGRLGGNYVPTFEKCGVPIAQLIYEVAGRLCLDMGGSPVGKRVRKFRNVGVAYSTNYVSCSVGSLAQGWGVIDPLASFWAFPLRVEP